MKNFKPGDKTWVRVSVATVWRDATSPRAIDQDAISTPANPEKWVAAMSNEDKLNLLGRVDSQALYGTKATIISVQDQWAEVQVHGQPGHDGSPTYPGWLPCAQLSFLDNDHAFNLVVIASKTSIYDNPECQSPTLEVSYNTQLPVAAEQDQAFQVYTPDGLKWVEKSAVSFIDAEVPSGETIIKEARRFIGLDYLWGGMSAYGFDCSGFVHTIYKRYGVTIPRDAGDQFKSGTAISKEGLKPGDLVFFAHEKGKGDLHHVGFYAGDGMLLHSPQTGSPIECLDLWSHPVLADEFIGGRRYL